MAAARSTRFSPRSLLIVGAIVTAGLLWSTGFSHRKVNTGTASIVKSLAGGSFRRARFPGWSKVEPAVSADVQSLCDYCTCRKDDEAKWWERYPQAPSSERPSHSISKAADVGSWMRMAAIEAWCAHVHVKDPMTALDLLKADPITTLAWEMYDLVPGRPTLFTFTKTAPFGSKLTPAVRRSYFDRHVQTIVRHREIVDRQGYFDGVSAQKRQVLWIIVEDNEAIDPNLVDLLTDSGINWLYVAFGPTRSYGNAQHNAALSIIHTLTTSGALGHGPFFGMDDDAEIHEDLFDWVWKIKRIGIWPMGNLGPTGFEGPEWDETGEYIVSWDVMDDPSRNRTYPIDNGAFAIRSEMLGTAIAGPNFYPFDVNGGQSARASA